MPETTDQFTPGQGGALTAPLTPADHEAVLAANELAAHTARATKNRKAGLPAPSPGTKLYVTCGRGIKSRRRAGIDFVAADRTLVTVVTGTDTEVAAKVAAGEAVVNVAGAERILADDSLSVHSTPAVDMTNAASELEAANSELAELRRKLAAATKAALPKGPPKAEGKPERLAPPGLGDFGEGKSLDDDKGKA